MLMDKGYYDYDYSTPEENQNRQVKQKSREELDAMMSRFGFKTKLRTSSPKPLTPSELQAEMMKYEKGK